MSNLSEFGLKNIVAVYGTLRYGGSANNLMEGCEHLGRDTINGKLYSLGAYPGIKLGGAETVVVDIYSIPSPVVLERLDRYEGYFKDDHTNSLYVRKEVMTNESGLTVWCYEFVEEVYDELPVPSGDWLLFSYKQRKLKKYIEAYGIKNWLLEG